jgi:hypothetical protein
MHFQNKRILNAHWVFLLGVGIRLKLPFFIRAPTWALGCGYANHDNKKEKLYHNQEHA